MHQYFLNESVDLLTDVSALGKILQDYQTRIVPLLCKRKNYYDGKHKILSKVFENSDREPAKIVCNMIYEIVNNYLGYAVGIAPKLECMSENENETLNDVLNYNDFDEQAQQLFRDGLIFGRSALLMYIDREGMTRFSANLDPRNVIPVYDDTIEHNLLYGIRFWEMPLADDLTPDYYVEVYNDNQKVLYKSDFGFATFTFIKAEKHNFNQVPFCIFSLNKEEVGLCDQVFALQDALNAMLSDRQDEEDSFNDATLILTGAMADSDDLASVKRNKVMMLDEGAKAEFLIKDISKGSQSESLIDRIEDKIREIVGCPDFHDEKFATSSGIALRYKLLQMENNTAGFVNQFKKVLQKMVELIGGVERLKTGDEFWRDVQITFTRNLPVDDTANAQVVSTLRGIVSDTTLLKLLPFVEDPEEEAKKVQEQEKERVDFYTEVTMNGDQEADRTEREEV